MRTIAFLCLILLAGCSSTPWRVDYLNSVLGKANHDDIATRLGAPDRIHKLENGGDVWNYQYCNSQGAVAGNRGIGGVYGASSSACAYYTLTFDHRGILQKWNRDE